MDDIPTLIFWFRFLFMSQKKVGNILFPYLYPMGIIGIL